MKIKIKDKLCACCGGKIECSISALFTVPQTRPRIQKCSKSLLLCRLCIKDLLNNAAAASAAKLRDVLQETYTATELILSQRIDAK